MKKLSIVIIIVCLIIGLWASSSLANLTVSIKNGYNLIVDSNITSPSTYSPRAAYIGAEICNTGSSSVNNVVAYVGDYKGGTGSTPGIYPTVNTNVGTWPPHIAGTGTYSLTHEADETGREDATRYIGTLGAGECRMQYWLVSYPQCVNVDPDGTGPKGFEPDYPPCAKSITGDIKPSDDLSLRYDVWVKGDSVPTAYSSRTFTMRNEISSSANKIWPNTSSKVPDEYLNAIQAKVGWGTLGPDGQPLTDTNPVYPGQRVITTQGIWYDLGNVNGGFDNNGDLIPDRNAWLQPVGDAAAFDPDCFRLVRTYGIVIVKLVGGGEYLIPFQDELYFTNLPNNTGVVGLVYYQFIATDQGCTAEMMPYQEAASGNDNEKFSSDFGLSLILKSGVFPTNIITKTDGLNITAPNTTSTYTITVNNTTGINLGAPDLGISMMITDSIPEGTTFVGNSTTITIPQPNETGSFTQGYTDSSGNLDTCTINYRITSSSYQLLYSTDNRTSWQTSQPSPESSVTDLRWIVNMMIELDGDHNGTDCVPPDGNYDNGTQSTSLPAGKIVTAGFQVAVGANAGPIIINTATLGFGGAASTTKAIDTTLVSGNNTISGSIFVDSNYNGTKDSDETTGIGNGSTGVVVKLYFDVNGDGKYDSGDILYTQTYSAASTGNYSFTNLPDGKYVVVVSKYDGTSNAQDVDDFTQGYGNTTRDPNLLDSPPNTGLIKMTENSTTVSLAVNVDVNHSSGTTTLSNVNFGFAPPLVVTKGIAYNVSSITEGGTLTYKILLQNRLPSVGRQGPTGCEYTVWTQKGTNGSPKGFTDYTKGFDAVIPNRSTAYVDCKANTGGTYMEGGDNTGNNFPLQQIGNDSNIGKVEALYFAYYSATPVNDYLEFQAFRGATANTAATFSTAMIDSYVGEPPDIDPNNAISWDITSLRPGGGTWSWSDFTSTTNPLKLRITTQKSASSDGQTVYLDAIGIRVTTKTDCESSDSTTLSPVPLEDTFDADRFTFISSDPPPTSVTYSGSSPNTVGIIRWDDVGPITPGNSRTVTVTVRAKDVDGTVSGSCTTGSEDACNKVTTDYTGKDVKYADGRIANDSSSNVSTNIVGRGEIRGRVWNDNNPQDGWPDNDGEPGIPNVTLTLYACVITSTGVLYTGSGNNDYCNGTKSWKPIATAVTDPDGKYEFIGLEKGYYIVEVGDTNGIPVTGNNSPFNGTQRAEPNDNQAVSGGWAVGTNGTCAGSGGCNNTWGNPNAELLANQTTINLLNDGTQTEETINGVNFAYTLPSVIYGTVWYDINANRSRNDGEAGLSGFIVELSNGSCTLGSNCPKTTTDSNGHYSFSSGIISGNTYTIVVTPPPLPTTAWVETVESSGGTVICPIGGTGCLDNQITVVASTGLSGPHNFGFTQSPTTSIGDTIYYDFNGNGIKDSGEDGIPNITVFLYRDIDKDGIIDDGVDTLFATTTTNSSGIYLFNNVPYGSYVVVVDTSDPDFPSNVLQTGDPDTNAGSISGKVWLDANNDKSNTGEDGIPEVVVLLYEESDGVSGLSAGDKVVAATLTDLYGNYMFSSLNSGKYYVDVDETTLPGTSLAMTTTPDPKYTVREILIRNGTNPTQITNVDVGYRPSSGYALGNRIWSDANGNGVQDPGEVGIGGVKLTITGGSCSPNCITYTDRSGYWILTGLSAGTYTITADSTTLPIYFKQTPQSPPTQSCSSYSRTATIATADVMNADMGFRYDISSPNCNTDTRDAGDPTGTLSGTVCMDTNQNGVCDTGEAMGNKTVNLFDKNGNLVATTTTHATTGAYEFSGVFMGIYMIQALDRSGNYTTTFLASGSSYTGLNLIYNYAHLTVADHMSSVTVDGAHPDLMQDFGYQRFFGSIGDTIYHDINENATQDLGEPGISDVTVRLYIWKDKISDGGNGNGLIDENELTLYAETTTSADDPGTSADESGKYLFTNLNKPPDGQYYVVRVNTATLPGTAVLTADPDTDGDVCTNTPPPSGCDNQQAVIGFKEGNNYLGADFGYKITASGYATIGDTLWIDTNGDGIRNAGETGVSYVRLYIDSNNNGTLDSDEPLAYTDADGYYFFSNLADGTYHIRVLTSDLPDGLTAVYESGGSINNHVAVTVSSGQVTAIDGNSCSDCNLNVDFGYRYTGSNTVSGTIGIDDVTKNGYLGSTPTVYSGVDTANGESALSGIQVHFYQWIDHSSLGIVGSAWASNGTIDTYDTFTYLGYTTTNASGDYSFSNLPNNVIVVVSTLASDNLKLTTTSSNSSVNGATTAQFYEGTSVYDGNTVTVSVRQLLTGLSSNTQGVDFAFENKAPVDLYDFGDLPASYTSNLLSQNGARHRVTGTSIYLGDGVTTEADGRDSPTASADVDDGVTIAWGNPNTATLTIKASAAGWLAGWMDFNGDGDFLDDGERIINQAVSAGNNNFTITIPSTGWGKIYFNSRFRIYPQRPVVVSSAGIALNDLLQPTYGEVEDYQFIAPYDFGDLPARYNANLLSQNGAQHWVSSNSIRLGAGVTTETNGQNSDAANADANDDGVTPSPTWNLGDNQGVVTVNASADGWVAGWIDFNNNGDFSDPGEAVISQAVNSGNNVIRFTVPNDVTVGTHTFLSRFRIYPSEPSTVSPMGLALNSSSQPTTGEVEDYQWNIIIRPTYALINDFKAYVLNRQVIIEWQTSGEVGTVGYYLERLHSPNGKYKPVNKDILPALITASQGGVYRLMDDQAVPGGTYTYQVIELDNTGKENRYGPFTVMAIETLSEPMKSLYEQKAHSMPEDVKTRLQLAKEARKAAKTNNRKRSGNVVKMSTYQSGLHYLSANEMASLFGVSLNTAINAIQTNHVSLINMGKDVAYIPAKDHTGIYFYAEPIQSIYTSENVYWLKMEKGVQMNRVKIKPKKISPANMNQTFPWTSHAEVNKYAATGLTDPEVDYWLWDYVYAGYPTMDTKSFVIPTPGVDVKTGATLIVRLQGGNNTPVSPDHHVVVRFNGNEMGHHFIEGMNSAVLNLKIEPWMLRDGENTVEIKAIKDTGASTSVVYVDYFDLTYQRYYLADRNWLQFSAQDYTVLTISGFDTPDIGVIDITDPKMPKLVEVQTDRVSGAYQITFEPTKGSIYEAVAWKQAILATDVWMDKPSALVSEKNRANYILIAPSELREQSKTLADYRQTQGFETMVVELEDIMDEFNAGIFTPWAIHDFLTYAYYHWEKPPTYVLLIGTGTYDYKNYMNLGGNLMPPVLVRTPYGMFASDNRLADIVGDDSIPEMAIGRIPVLTEAELQATIDKIVAYETAAIGDWAKRVMLIADNADEGGNFPNNSDELIKILPPSYQPLKMYLLPKVVVKTLRTQILSGISTGVGWIHYTGHGGMDRLAQEGLLTSTDVNTMTNTLYPVMTFMTCQTGRFEFPGFDSLAEKLINKKNGGAVAVWTTTGLADNYASQILADAYFRSNVAEGEKRVGRSITHALRTFGEKKQMRFMLDIYHLFGDPALRIHP